MGLQGPFPATLEIESKIEGEALLSALGALKRQYELLAEGCDTCNGWQIEADRFDRLYAKVLRACGDD